MNWRSPLLALLRVAWLSLPFAAGAVLSVMLAGRSDATRWVSGAGLWAGWSVGLLACLVLLPVALTTVRLLSAAAVAVVMVATVVGSPGAWAALGGLGAAGVAAATAFLPETTVHFVNGPAYPNERRFPLRVPFPLLLGPVPVAAAVAVGGPVAGALLLAARQWVLGAIVTAVALPVSYVLLRAVHGLARRWLVFVPAGAVLHDPMTLADPVLFTRQMISAFGPAGAEAGDAVDLTQRALGVALELRVQEPAPLALVRPGSRHVENVTVTAVRFTVTRPGAVLAEAARRRLVPGGGVADATI